MTLVEAHASVALHGAWRTLLDALHEPAWIVEPQRLTLCAVNAAALALVGKQAAEVVGQPAQAMLATPEDLAYWADAADGHGDALHSEAVLVDAQGRLRHVSRRIQPLALASEGAVAAPVAGTHYLVALRDETDARRRNDERELLVAELQATLESTADGILVTDLSGRIRVFNRQFAALWGLPEGLLADRRDAAVAEWMLRGVADPQTYAQRLAVIADATLLQASERIVLRSGRVLERVTQPQCCQGRVVGRVWAFRDRTDIVQADQQIETLATTDELTGLANRRQLTHQMTRSMADAAPLGAPLALLLLDIDHFKQVNDSLGAAVGDRVLQDTAERLRACIRQGDVAARLGGDQFALLVHGADAGAAALAARRLLAAVAQTRRVDGLEFTLTASVGVALYPADAQDAAHMLRVAEQAMLNAKRSGRECFRLHRPQDAVDQRDRLALDHAMRQALTHQRFRLHYQPQIDLASGRVVGAEALLRWRDPELGEVSPARFIPVAEDSGFIIALGDWVLQQAVRQAARWLQGGLSLPVSINVSALQFARDDFAERVAAALAEQRLPGAMLELELTESILLHDAEEALRRLAQLSRLGVRLAIDDFGTGYSSLAYLKRYPIDRLKIDRSFVRGVPGDESDTAIVRAVVQLARALGMMVIGEGVETEAQREFLQDIGCHQYQGFLFAPALEPWVLEDRLRDVPMPPKRPKLTLVGR